MSTQQHIEFLENQNTELRSENDTLRQALGIYACPDNWCYEYHPDDDESYLHPEGSFRVLDTDDGIDGFEIAQKALTKGA